MKTVSTNNKKIQKILVAAIALVFLATAPLAAQDYGSQEQQNQQGQQDYGSQKQGEQQGQESFGQGEQEKKEFSEEELEKFAEAQPEVEEVRSEYSKELQDVKDNDKARELQEKYSQQMVEVIEDAGLTVQKYNEIAMAVQNDPDLKEKIDEMSQ